MTRDEMRAAATDLTEVYRYLGDRQDTDVTLKPRQVQRIVTACVNAAHCISGILDGKIDPVNGGFRETEDAPSPPPVPQGETSGQAL